MKSFFLVIFLVLALSTQSYAQSRSYAASEGPRKNFTTIVFAGLGGAVLGLSTLSFHGRPQDHMDSIAIGFAVGIIAGAIYTSYKAATDPANFYGYEPSKFDLFVKTDAIVQQKPSYGTTIFQYTF